MTPMNSRKTRRRGGRTLVETALVVNLMVVILIAVFEYGRLIMIKQIVDNAAREGARFAVVSTNTNPPTTQTQIISTVNGFLVNQPLANLNIQVYEADPTTGKSIGSWSSAPFGEDIAVQIDADYQPMVPATFGILPSSLHLTAKSVMRSEAN
jgi:Flp pilus assembly protein TadG